MKLMIRNWWLLVGFLAAGLLGATYLLAQTQATQNGLSLPASGASPTKLALPAQQEAADCARLIDAVNAGDVQTTINILRAYNVADDTLLAMATRLGKPTARATLEESFLKASVGGLATMDRVVKTNVQAQLRNVMSTVGYDRPTWMVRPDVWAAASYEDELSQCPVPPIGVLDIRLNDPCFIRFFKWYDRYAERLHSVMVNGAALSNTHIDPANYNQADRTLKALFRLIKARKPDAFVWLSLVKKDDRTDELWLKSMSFQPDGLQISNLRQFHSPFAETRARYVAIVGADMPLMVAGFTGYTAALDEKRKQLSAVVRTKDTQQRQAATTAATLELGNIGAAAQQEFFQVETNLQSLGYRGLSVHWLLLAALANSTNATVVDRSDLLGSRAGLLDIYFGQKDYGRMLTLAADMVSNSAPGDMSWTVGKLYEGIAWLSQTPAQTGQATRALDEVLTFDFGKRPGRDHYILGAAKWRVYAASLSGDREKGPQIAHWVQTQNFRADLKSDFLKKYGDLMTSPPTTAQ